jgi:hypothetical protein
MTPAARLAVVVAALAVISAPGCSVLESLNIGFGPPAVELPADGAAAYARELCALPAADRGEFRALMASTLGAGGPRLTVTCSDDGSDQR